MHKSNNSIQDNIYDEDYDLDEQNAIVKKSSNNKKKKNVITSGT